MKNFISIMFELNDLGKIIGAMVLDYSDEEILKLELSYASSSWNWRSYWTGTAIEKELEELSS